MLEKFGVVPSLVAEPCPPAPSSLASHANVGREEARGKSLRVVTWSIARGLKSDDAPSSHNLMDQQASVMKEVLRWERSYGCDVLALQECADCKPTSELAEIRVCWFR